MKDKIACSFCTKTIHEVKKIVSGPELLDKETSYICDECIEVGYNAIHKTKAELKPLKNPSPEEIKAHLDKYIVEQHTAKEALSVTIYNHFKRIKHPTVGTTTLKKSNALLIGPSGTGKTLLVSTVASLLDIPFVHADATSLTEAGYVGEDVEHLIERLISKANGDIEAAQNGIIYLDEIDKKSRKTEGSTVSRDVSGEGVQQALLKLIEGTTIDLPKHGGSFDTTNVLFIAAGAFVGLEDIIKEHRREYSTIGFNATVDKPHTDMLLLDTGSEDLIKFGMIPEFVGRFPVIIALHELDENMLTRILVEPQDCIADQYKSLFQLDNIELEFSPIYLRSVATKAMKEKTGARGLQGVLEKALSKTQFQLPSLYKKGVTKVIMNEAGIPTLHYVKRKVNDE